MRKQILKYSSFSDGFLEIPKTKALNTAPPIPIPAPASLIFAKPALLYLKTQSLCPPNRTYDSFPSYGFPTKTFEILLKCYFFIY